MKDRLIELINEAKEYALNLCLTSNVDDCIDAPTLEEVEADYLLKNGVLVTPCVAMIEQFIKDGKFDKRHEAHNGRIAVVYFDKSKWNCPLIDITEQFYNTGKAYERIEVLKGGVENGTK